MISSCNFCVNSTKCSSLTPFLSLYENIHAVLFMRKYFPEYVKKGKIEKKAIHLNHIITVGFATSAMNFIFNLLLAGAIAYIAHIICSNATAPRVLYVKCSFLSISVNVFILTR